MTTHKPPLRKQTYWETVGGKHGRFGHYRPWYAQEVGGWEPDPERPLHRRKIVARREGPFRTKAEAEAFIEADKVEACACGEQR